MKKSLSQIRHIRNTHQHKRFECEFCSKLYTDSMTLKAHKMRAHGLVKAEYSCAYCHQQFLFLSQYKTHMSKGKCIPKILKSTQKPKEIKCESCLRVFSNETNLKRHRDAIHLNIKRFECEICKKSFSQKTALNAHWRIHTGTVDFSFKKLRSN